MDERQPPVEGDEETETLEALQARLEAADPVEAPALADEIAARLSALLDEGTDH